MSLLNGTTDWTMQKLSKALLALPLMFLASLANAQSAGTVTFTSNQTTATGSLVPVLTWSTSPVAASCAAGGGWSGTKFASGSETLPTITASTSYTLNCSWSNGSATINWTPPTQNVDGTALTNLTGFKVLYGTSATSLTQSVVVNNPSATSTTVASLPAGTWYFAVRALNSQQLESDNSNVVQKVIAAVSASRTVNITINAAPPPPPPPPPTGQLLVFATPVFDVLQQNGVYVLGRQIGTVAIGRRCVSTFRIGSTNYYQVNSSYVTVTTSPRSGGLVVADCRVN
jgi:hypothetical protein